jgi:tRNA pseudouridine38/39 synthase
VQRQYKYFVLSQPGEELDVGAMRAGAAAFIGCHDFRCFCKPDAAHVRSFARTVHDFRVEPEPGCAWAGGQRVLALHVTGSAFLWHQARVQQAAVPAMLR